MSTESNDQYRAGFEAWATGPNGLWHANAMVRNKDGHYEDQVRLQFDAWVAAKSEASTEPSAWMCPAAIEPEFTADALLAGYWMRKGRTVTPLYAGAGALSDDAKAVIDAARKLVQCKGRYHTELNFKELAAAIEAHKAGSGT